MANQRWLDSLPKEARLAYLAARDRRRYNANLEKGRAKNAGKRERARARAAERGTLFVSIDGEGWDVGGKHCYTLLQASTGAEAYNPEGLPTEECLEFLLAAGSKDVKLVGFGMSYDVNMMLGDVPEATLRELREEQSAIFKGERHWYRLNFVDRKSFTVTRVGTKKKTVTLWETLGFFQQSFAKAVEAWGVATPSEQAFIEEMKGRRGEFDPADLDRIRAYNQLEVELHVRLMGALDLSLRECGIKPARWDGAGAVAGQILRQKGVAMLKSQGEPTYPKREILHAYYGARVFAPRRGEIEGPIYNYDLCSAYPAAMRLLPSLAGGTWRERGAMDALPDNPFALSEVVWELPGAQEPHPDLTRNPHYPLTPFPWRDEGKCINYPWKGRGIYWAPLVEAALQAWPDHIRVHRRWELLPATDARPFAWIDELYEQRRAYKAAGNAAEKALKLGMNSLYGKLAQGKGYGGRVPTHQEYAWAGYITAWCQAQVLSAALQRPQNLISINTDGVWLDAPLTLDEGKGLGQWEASVYDRLWVIQPGVYVTEDSTGYKLHSRGFPPLPGLAEAMVAEWRKSGPLFELPVTFQRFVGYRQACAWNDFSEWRTWKEITKELSLLDAGDDYLPIPGTSSGWALEFQPEEAYQGLLPMPYTPKGKVNDEMHDDEITVYEY